MFGFVNPLRNKFVDFILQYTERLHRATRPLEGDGRGCTNERFALTSAVRVLRTSPREATKRPKWVSGAHFQRSAMRQRHPQEARTPIYCARAPLRRRGRGAHAKRAGGAVRGLQQTKREFCRRQTLSARTELRGQCEVCAQRVAQ